MALDLVPGRFWSFPRWLTVDEDEEIMPTAPSGLSVYEDDKNVYVEAAVPGVKPDNIEVTFDKGILWIKGESQEKEENKKAQYYRRATNSFSYRVAVPGEIDQNVEPEANCENGVCTITFAKHPQTQPRKISVKGTKKEKK